MSFSSSLRLASILISGAASATSTLFNTCEFVIYFDSFDYAELLRAFEPENIELIFATELFEVEAVSDLLAPADDPNDTT